MSSPTISFFSNALSYVNNVLKQSPTSEFLDIGEVLIGLSLLVFRDPKTKVSVQDHELHRDHYYSFLNFQGLKKQNFNIKSKLMFLNINRRKTPNLWWFS